MKTATFYAKKTSRESGHYVEFEHLAQYKAYLSGIKDDTRLLHRYQSKGDITMDRSEHLEWCKKRANEYINDGDITGAYASMSSDLQKHPETANHPAVGLGVALMMGGHLSTSDEMQKFIDGFN